MRCAKCGHKFHLQSPGMGFHDAPGRLLLADAPVLALGVAFFVVSWSQGWPWLVTGIIVCMFPLSHIPDLLDSRQQFEQMNAGVCPSCKSPNPIRLWSI